MALGAIAASLGGAAAAALASKLANAAWKFFTGSKKKKGKTGKLPGGAKVIKTDAGEFIQTTDMPKELHDKMVERTLELLNRKPELLPTMQELATQGAEAFKHLSPEALRELLPTEELAPYDFGAMEEQARKGFFEKIVPTIAERFTALGGAGQRSSGLEGRLAEAGANLEGMLAARRAQMEPEYNLKRAMYGLKRAELGGRLAELGMKPYQMALQHAGAQQAIKSGETAMLPQYLAGTRYQTAFQPAAPTFMQGLAGGAGQAFGRAAPDLVKSLYDVYKEWGT